MVNIEIDGVKLQAEPGSMIIEAADEAGIVIPRFCYHKKLSVAANCRMCLVEVANAPKAVPACATPISDGMVVHTQSERAKEAQKSVMEFLLINHPLDCPICDQGGECELQDVALGYGQDVSRFTERKRVVKDKNIGPLIATDMTRCIHCTRCVRFGQEVAGMREMGATGRGEHVEIGTFVEKSVSSEVSGNIIDLCPVGALTAKPSRFQARAWEMQQHDSVAPHDCLGSNVHIHTRRNEVIRVVPKENESINEVWLSDRDRFGYEGLASDSRALLPKIRKNDAFETVSWEEALSFVAEKLQQYSGDNAIGALYSPSSTIEEMHLLKQMCHHLGTDSIDYRMAHRDDRLVREAALYPAMSFPIESLQQLDACLLVGSNIRHEQPIAALRLRKSTFDGVVMAINPEHVEYNFKLSHKVEVALEQHLGQLMAVLKAAVDKKPFNLPQALSVALAGVEVQEYHQQMAMHLMESNEAAVILGAIAMHSTAAAEIEVIARYLCDVTGARIAIMTQGANAVGAHIVGALPLNDGSSAKDMLQQGKQAFVLMNCEPEKDSYLASEALTAMQKADFVVSITPFESDALNEYADAILPVGAFSESSGTFVNTNGTWQSFKGAVANKGEARPAWKVLRVLGNLLKISGFDYVSSEDVLAEVKKQQPDEGADLPPTQGLRLEGLDFALMAEGSTQPMYQIDALVRRALALHQVEQLAIETKEDAS